MLISMQIRRWLAVIALLGLAGCASGANTANMTASLQPNLSIAPSSGFYQAIEIDKIGGGDETNPLLASKVSNPSFKAALKSSLHRNHLYATGAKKYTVSATIVGLKQPLFGINMTVGSAVHYKVARVADGKVGFDQIISASHTATFGDSALGVERLRKANEGSIKKNIAQFITTLSTLPA